MHSITNRIPSLQPKSRLLKNRQKGYGEIVHVYENAKMC